MRNKLLACNQESSYIYFNSMINTATLCPHMKTICQNRTYPGLCSSGMLQGRSALLVTNTLSHRNEDPKCIVVEA